MTARPALLLALSALALAGCPVAPAPGAAGVAGVGSAGPRIVTSSPALAEMLCAVGAGPQLVGVSRYCLEPPELGALPRIGGAIDPNLEAIDALAPDLILVQGRDERLAELVARRPYRLVSIRVETLAEARDAFAALGRLTGHEAQGVAAVARLDAELADVRRAAPAVPVTALVVFGHRPGELGQVSAPGAATFVAEALAAAGGQSCLGDLPGDAWHVLSLEAVLSRAPALIVELSPDPVDAATAAALRADWTAAVPGVPAVRDGRVAIVQGSEVLIPGPRLGRLARKLLRAVRGDVDVRDDPAGP